MPPGRSDAELRFVASLEDDVTPKAEKLEKKLKQMGASPSEIKMMLKAHDEASPKIKEAQKNIDQLPREHVTRIRAEYDDGAVRSASQRLSRMKADAETPIKMRFEGLEQAKETMDQLFNLRTRIQMPVGNIPGLNMLYGVGAGAGIAGVGSAAIGAVGQGVQINSQMEQSMVTLNQTLKDQAGATKEMGELVEFARKTPFGYSDVVAADVRLRSYQIPAMKGEGGPENKGWLQASGDMAAALNTPITQAVEAIADARQGYFVRMMTYGIRIMREDFEKGGKYAGLTYEQGLERALKRFEGSMEMQSRTFQGVMSNIQDVMQQNVLKPLGGAPFELMRTQALGIEQKLQDPDFQRELGTRLQEITKGMLNFYDLLRKGKEYFDLNLKQPLMEVTKNIVELGATFGRAFGGTTLTVLTTVAEALTAIIRPITDLINKYPIFMQVYGVFKALSLLGFSNITTPFRDLVGGLNPLNASITRTLKGLMGIPKAITGIGIALFIKGLSDAHNAARSLNDQFDKMDNKGLDRLNADVSLLAAKLGESATEMKELTALAAKGLPRGKDRDERAMQVAELGAQLENKVGVNQEQAVRMIIAEAQRNDPWREKGEDKNRFSERSLDKFAKQVAAAAGAAEELGMSMKDANQAMTMYGKAGSKINLGGTEGLPYLMALSRTGDRIQPTDKQLEQGMQSGAQMVLGLLGEAASPGAGTLEKIRKDHGSLDEIFKFRKGGKPSEDAFEILSDIQKTFAANERATMEAERFIGRVAPSAKLPRTPNPFVERGFGVDVEALQNIEDPTKQAEALGKAWIKNQKNLGGMNDEITKLNEKINTLNNVSNQYGQALESISIQMTEWQMKNMKPLQRNIEDASLALREYQMNAMRPLERQMQSLGNESSKLGHTMSNAQYEFQKYSKGLLTGEQAALKNIHALERYNKQLQLLQLSYQQMGAELGTTEHQRGFSSRVEPMMGLNLQVQMERLQRKQQREQLEYELGYGEQHYKLQQAGRGQFERQEMGFGERMQGVQQNIKVIDETSVAQHRMQNEQFELQQKMFGVNQEIQDQQDNINGLQLTLSKLQASKTMRNFIDDQDELQLRSRKVGLRLQTANIELNKMQEAVLELKEEGKRLGEAFTDALDWGGAPEKNIKRLERLAEIMGWGPGQRKNLRGAFEDAEKGAAEGRKKGDELEDTSRFKQIWQGVKGTFLGDTWQKIGDNIQRLPGVGSVSGVGAATQFLGTGTSILMGTAVAGVLAGQGGRMIFDALANSSRFGTAIQKQASRLGRGLGRAAPVVRRVPLIGSYLSRGMVSRALRMNEIGAGRAARGGFWGRLRDAPRLIRNWRGTVGAGLGVTLGGLLGGPPGALAGGLAGRRLGHRTTLRQVIRGGFRGGFRGLLTGFRTFRKGTRLFFRGSKQSSAAAKVAKKASDKADDVARATKQTNRAHRRGLRGVTQRFNRGLRTRLKSFGNRVGGFRKGIRRFTGGKGVGLFARIVGVFGSGVAAFKGVIGKLAKLLGFGDSWVEKGAKEIRQTQKLREVQKLRDARKGLPKNIDWDEVAKEAGKGNAGFRGFLKSHPNVAKGLKGAGIALDASIVAAVLSGAISQDPAMLGIAGIGGAKGGRAAMQSFANRKAAAGVGAKTIAKQGVKKFGSKFIPFVGQGLLAKDLWDIAGGLTGGGLEVSEDDPRENPEIAAHMEQQLRILPRAAKRRLARQLRRERRRFSGTRRSQSGTHAFILDFLTEKGYAGGLRRVPEDDFPAVLHQDEAVLNAAEANVWRNKGGGAGQDEKERHLQQVERIDKTFRDKDLTLYQAYITEKNKQSDDHKDREVKKREKFQKHEQKAQEKHGDEIVQIVRKKGNEHERTYGEGWKAIHVTTEKWIGKVAKLVEDIDSDLGLTSDDKPRKKTKNNAAGGIIEAYARGGLVRGAAIPKGKIIRVAEEGFDEVVIPLAPHRRNRAISLVQQTVGRLGGMRQDVHGAANGAIQEGKAGQDQAYLTARGVMDKVSAFAEGGFTGPSGSLAGMTPLANFAAKKFGLGVSAGKDDHDFYTVNGNPSDHGWGGALDLSNGTSPTPGMMGMYNFLRTKLKNVIKQVIYMHNLVSTGGGVSNYGPTDHFNHVHAAILEQYARDPEAMAKIIDRASRGISIADLMKGGGSTGGAPLISLPEIGKGIKEKLNKQGPFGRLIAKKLARKRRQWQKALDEKAGSFDSGGISAGGDVGVRRAAMRIAREEGWNFSDWWKLIMGESGGTPGIMNAQGSGAFGIGQFLPMNYGVYGPGSDPAQNPTGAQQVEAMARYIKARPDYGNPTKAYQLWLSRSPHWYAHGGLVVGDSLDVGTKPYLGGWDVSATGGMSSSAGVGVLKSQLKPRHKTVVFDMGTNDAVPSQLRGSLQKVKQIIGDRRLLVSTIHSPAGEAFNSMLKGMKGIDLVPWDEIADKNPGWFGSDQIHASAAGYRARARLINRVHHSGTDAETTKGDKSSTESSDRWWDPYVQARYAGLGKSSYASGIDRVPRDQVANLHEGEMVIPRAIAESARSRKGKSGGKGHEWWEKRIAELTESILDIKSNIRKSSRSLKNIEDKEDKSAARQNLAKLNEMLRGRWRARNRATNRADSSLRKLIYNLGDASGGEGTLAGVQRETQIRKGTVEKEVKGAAKAWKQATRQFNKAVNKFVKKPARRKQVRRGTRLILRADKARRRGQGRLAKRLARRGRKLTRRGLRGVGKRGRRAIGRARTRLRRAGQRKDTARGRGDAKYVIGAAMRGVSSRLMRAIRGQKLSPKQERLYRRIERSVARTGKANSGAVKSLRKSLVKESLKTRKQSSKNRQSTEKTTKARNAAREKAARARDRARQRREGGRDRQRDNRAKARRSQADRHDARANKLRAEQNKKLERIAGKNLVVNIHNTAYGATISTRRDGGRTRNR